MAASTATANLVILCKRDARLSPKPEQHPCDVTKPARGLHMQARRLAWQRSDREGGRSLGSMSKPQHSSLFIWLTLSCSYVIDISVLIDFICTPRNIHACSGAPLGFFFQMGGRQKICSLYLSRIRIFLRDVLEYSKRKNKRI